MIAYHTEKHLEETYIVKERIVSLLRRLQRRLKQRGLQKQAEALKSVDELVQSRFEDIVRTRGMHVHKGRFEDEDVKRVGSLDLLVSSGGMKQLEPLRRHHARSALTKWRKTSAANVQAIESLLNVLIEGLEPVVFDTLAPPEIRRAAGDPTRAT